jgi:uncharacterized protein (DUF1697 family)
LTAFVALLRGVNVGGANRLPMPALKELFALAGASRIETLIQSGNVIFQADQSQGADIAETVRRQIQRRFGFDSPIVLRDASQWRALIAGNPFLTAGIHPEQLHVACLSSAPDASALARLDPQRSAPDAFAVVGADIYLHLPNGVARTKLSNSWFDAKLGVASTLRNWRTATRLAEALSMLPD